MAFIYDSSVEETSSWSSMSTGQDATDRLDSIQWVNRNGSKVAVDDVCSILIRMIPIVIIIVTMMIMIIISLLY